MSVKGTIAQSMIVYIAGLVKAYDELLRHKMEITKWHTLLDLIMAPIQSGA